MTLPEERLVEHGTLGLHAVLVAVDGSRTSLRAADYALGQAHRTGTGVIGIYVRPYSALAVSAPGAWVYAESAQHAVAQELHDYLAERARELGLSCGFIEVCGSPAREVRRLAVELCASAVIVGASEHLSHRFYGSLAVRLARGARQPVIIVP